jgi:hypothetical protein
LSYAFASNELGELRKVLAEVDSHTVVTPVGGTSDFCLNSEGKTANGYSYSGAALVQLCGMLAPGLAQFISDASGQWRKAGEDIRSFSGDLAIDTFNRTVRLRFDRRLSSYQLVRNTKLKIIDGIVGAKYRYLANSDFLNRVDRECVGRKSKFIESCLYGRQFMVRYVNQAETKPYLIAGDQYTFGYHFANSEIGGKAVKAAPLLVRVETGESALCTTNTDARVVHAGRDFEKKLHTLMGQIAQKVPNHTDIDKGSAALESQPLRLSGEDFEKKVKHISQILVRRRLSQSFARRVVSSAASMGRNNEDGLTDAFPSDRRKILESRTGYDLFVALIREAKRLPIDQREIAEQVAYSLLIGKINY